MKLLAFIFEQPSYVLDRLDFIQLMQNLFVITTADRKDPDQMPHNVAFHQGLHCLPGQK